MKTLRHTLLKSVIAVICTFSLILGSVMCVTAVPTTTDVTWYSFENLKTVQYGEKAMVFNTVVKGKTEQLTLSFPSMGGIRLVGKNPGFFEPASTKNITYTYNLDGTVSLTADGDITVKVNINAVPWSLSIYNASGTKVTEILSNRIWYGYTSGGTLSRVAIENSLDSDEVIYGLGERFSSFNRVGTRHDMFNRDYWSKEESSYKNIPIIHSSKGYTLYYNNNSYAIADIGYTNPTIYSYDAQSKELDYFIWAGTPLENISDFTALTGESMLLPKWAYQYIPGATSIGWESTGNQMSLLKQSVQEHEAKGVTLNAIFGESSFLGNKTAYDYVNNKNIKLMGWTAAFQMDEIYRDQEIYEWLPGTSSDPQKYDWPIFKTTSGTYSSIATMDFSHPAAKTLSINEWKNEILLGMRGMMLDYGEYVGIGNELSYSGMDRYEAHNMNSYYRAKVFYEIFNEYAGEQQWLTIMRAAGIGGQKYTAYFAGDQTADYDGYNRGLKGTLTSATAGMSNYFSQIGGLSNDPTKELYDRWVQLGTFSPIMMTHGSDGNELPWVEGTESVFLEHYWLRENIVNQIYSSAIKASKSGEPIVQPMAVAFPGKTSTLANEDQYIFAENFLVAPVTTAGATSRSVDLPNGTWVDLRTGTNYEGGKAYTMSAPQSYCPVLVRNGTVMPVTVATNTFSMFTDMNAGRTEATLITAPNGSRESVVWKTEDESTTFNSVANGNSFTVTSSSAQTTRVIIALGVKATSVKVNGISLTKSTSLPTSNSGFYVDGNKRTVIRVPSTWSTVVITTEDSDMSVVEDDTKVPVVSEPDVEAPTTPDEAAKEVYDYPINDGTGEGMAAIAEEIDVYYKASSTDTVYQEGDFDTLFDTTSLPGEVILHNQPYTTSGDAGRGKTTILYIPQKLVNFEVTLLANSLNTSNNDYSKSAGPSIVFGVQDRTKWVTDQANNGYEAWQYGFGGGFFFVGGWNNGAYVDRLLAGSNNGSNGWDPGFQHGRYFKVRVENGTVTMSHKWDATDWTNITIGTIPDSYTGGYVGIAFPGNATRLWNLKVTNLDYVEVPETDKNVLCVGDDVTADGGYATQLQSILGDGYIVHNAGIADKTASSTVSGSIRADAEDSIFAEHIAKNPEIVVINYGASDALSKNWGVGNTTGISAKEHFKNELLSLAGAYKKALPNAKIYIATSAANYTNDATYKANLAQVVEAQREVAAELGVKLIDVYAVTTIKASWFPNGELPNTAAATFIADEIAIAITGKNYLGDINGDGKLDDADIQEFNKALLNAKEATVSNKTDLNLDGKVDVLDMILLKKLLKTRA